LAGKVAEKKALKSKTFSPSPVRAASADAGVVIGVLPL
jgi:hypothetical protein